jgi:HAD superfamily hydrolase (TIGR01549 family)
MSRVVRGVLLDVDGTLIDSNDAHAKAWEDTFREFGYAIPADVVRPLVGMGGDKLLPRLTGLDHEGEVAQRMSARRSEVFKTMYLPALRAFPGAHDLLARFKGAKLQLVIATSAQRDELAALLEQAGLEEIVEQQTTSSDADHSKPDPDIIRAALEKGGLDADEAVMLGDTPYDVEAASRAGVPAVALRSGGWPDRQLDGALEIYDDVAHLAREFERSVFGRSNGGG